MENVAVQMELPSSFAEMSSADMQYDGGFNWSKALMITSIVCLSVAAIGMGTAVIGSTCFTSTGTELAFGRAVAGVGFKITVAGGVPALFTAGGSIIA